MRKINTIVIHCSDSEHGNVIRVNDWHNARGWHGVGYHFVITNGKDCNDEYLESKDGQIESGRPLKIIGSHARGMNTYSIGICLIGTNKYTDKQRDSLKRLVKELQEKFEISDEDVIGHREIEGVSKSCPTDFDMDEFRSSLK